MVGEDGHLPHAETALGQLQVGHLQRVSRSRMLEIEVAAQEEVRVGVMRGRGGEGL